MDDYAILSQLGCVSLQFEGSEAPNGRGRMCFRHGDNSDTAGV
jgi:hypothetical protein